MSFDDVKKSIDVVLLSESTASVSKTIELGQTPQEVEKLLGTPNNIIKLGDKVT